MITQAELDQWNRAAIKHLAGDEYASRYIVPAIEAWESGAWILVAQGSPITQADGYAEAYPNGCPILPESND